MIALFFVVKERKYICYVFLLIQNSDLKAGVIFVRSVGVPLNSVWWRQIFGVSVELASCHSNGACSF